MRTLILAGALCSLSFPALADLVIVTQTAPPRIPAYAQPQAYPQAYPDDYREPAPYPRHRTGFVERRMAPPAAADAAPGCGRDVVRKGYDRSAWRPVPGTCG